MGSLLAAMGEWYTDGSDQNPRFMDDSGRDDQKSLRGSEREKE
jgi:hypothetical protein